MRKIHNLGFLVFLLGLCLLYPVFRHQDPVAARTGGAETSAPPDEELLRRLGVSHDLARDRRVGELANRQAERERRERAAGLAHQTRRELIEKHSGNAQWQAMIHTNLPLYRELLAKAELVPQGEPSCTICNGIGRMSHCVLCPEAKGKCADCNGKGFTHSGEICPTCAGTTKCYLCLGTGQMPCAFCDDGIINFKNPLPIDKVPLD